MDIWVERLFSDGPTRPISGRTIYPFAAGVHEAPTLESETFQTPLYPNVKGELLTKEFIEYGEHLTILVAPVYRDFRRCTGTDVHPEPVRQVVREIRASGGVVDGYLAAGNMNFGEAAYGGRAVPPGPVIGILDLSGNREVAHEAVNRLVERL